MEPPVEGFWAPPPPPAYRRLSPLVRVIVCAGLVWAVVVSFGALRLWAGAASDCQVFDAGNRAAVTVLYWPVFATVLWIVFDAPVLLLSRRSLALGVVIGIVLTLAIAYWFVAGTSGMILSSGAADGCPTGLPDWWPAWAPR
jgi:RsiW-degrading membrane proteinase PrsW (M82 family)